MGRLIRPNNPRYPHYIEIVRTELADGSPFAPVGSDTETVLYSGVGRAYTNTTTKGNKNVDVNKRECSIPLRYDMWENEILDGDIIKVRIGKITYQGVINDFEPDNERTVIYFERIRV